MLPGTFDALRGTATLIPNLPGLWVGTPESESPVSLSLAGLGLAGRVGVGAPARS